MAAFAVLFQQRLIERQGARDAVMLALFYAGLTLAHTFGHRLCRRHRVGRRPQPISGWLAPSAAYRCYRRPRDCGAGGVDAILCPAERGGQTLYVGLSSGPSRTARNPVRHLKLSMWIAIVELACLASAAAAGLRRGGLQFRTFFNDPEWQPFRYVTLALIGISGFTLVAWAVSVALYPLFVPRYFTPQLIVGFALHVAFGEWLMRQAQQRLGDRTSLAVCAAVVPPLLLSVMMLCRNPIYNGVPCANSMGTAFEADFVNGDTPVIAESPHVFLPRATYSSHRAAYRFPLDWDVVLNYPERARGNAVDYNVMRSLQKWGPMPTVMSTEDIVEEFPAIPRHRTIRPGLASQSNYDPECGCRETRHNRRSDLYAVESDKRAAAPLTRRGPTCPSSSACAC